MFVIGAPLLIILRKINSYIYYAITGASVGLVLSWISLVVLFSTFSISALEIDVILAAMLAGIICASISWAFLFLPIKKAAGEPPSSN